MSETSTLKGQCIAEFLGTGLLIFFGVGCVAALKVAGASFGQWEISIIWGLGVAMAIYLTAGVSGAHLNPAVTIALWLFACFDGRKVVPFILSQFAGAFCAAALVYGLYYNLFIDFEQTHQHAFRLRLLPGMGQREGHAGTQNAVLMQVVGQRVENGSAIMAPGAHQRDFTAEVNALLNDALAVAIVRQLGGFVSA
jgi:glycerol uptake facilitator-like aquaporin